MLIRLNRLTLIIDLRTFDTIGSPNRAPQTRSLSSYFRQFAVNDIQKLLKFSSTLPNPLQLSLPATVVLLALVGYLAVALAFQGFVFGSRTSLPEPDDAYTYILKSTQLADGCALQDCPALNSLRAQLQTKSAGENAEWQRYRFSGRVFLVYHPLYSVLLLTLNEAGFSWESGFMVLSFLGVVVIAAGLSFFLLALCGPAATAVALVLLTFSIFPGQGLTYIVPSNIALGIAFFALGFALRGHRWALAVASLLMLLMHPIGKVYSCLALVMALIVNRDFRPGLGGLLPYAVAAALIGASAAVPWLIDQPVLRVEPEPFPADFTVLGGLTANVWKAMKVVASGYGRAPVLGIPLALIVYLLAWRGYKHAPESIRRRLLIVGLILAGMCGALLLHVLPRYPAEAFLRGWIALAAVIAGAAGLAIVGPDGIPNRSSLASVRHWREPAVLCMGFLGAFVISGGIVLAQQALKIRDRHYQAFEPDQVRLLAERCGTAVHAGETSALFYLSHGGNACPSVYLPAFAGESGGTAHLRGLPAPFMLVAPKPGPWEIAIQDRQPVEITIKDGAPQKLHLLFPPLSPQPVLRISVMSAGSEQVDEAAPGEGDRTLTIDLPSGSEIKTVTIAVTSRFAASHLQGMRLDDDAQDWPWNRSVTLRSNRRLYAFSASDLTSGLFSSMDVLDSRGSTLLAKLHATN